MKNYHNLHRSARARLNEARRSAFKVIEICDLLADGHDSARMANFRETAERLLQSAHEYNAYATAAYEANLPEAEKLAKGEG